VVQGVATVSGSETPSPLNEPLSDAIKNQPANIQVGDSYGVIVCLRFCLLQVEEIFRRGVVLPFIRVLQLATNARDAKEVRGSNVQLLSSLLTRCPVLQVMEDTRQVARLVRGSWVLKSENLFQPHWYIRQATNHPC
jgi:hypothetical protein